MKEGIVVPHTHWDREWYQPFQRFRSRLVHMVDDLLDTLESDPAFPHFFFDGQTIVLDDYLEVRPQNRQRLASLIADGRIGVGPWYDMPDEFLVSGEALVRNLMKGMASAREFGAEAVRCGYVCDLFGHNSQFPQILQGFGIRSAVIARGFKDNSTPAEVWWESPDGSRVLAAKLDAERSYSDFYFAIRWPFDGREYDEEELVERMERHLAHKDSIQASSVYLLLEGVDHIEVEPKLPWIIDTLNRRIDGVTFRIGAMEDYFAAIEKEAERFPTIRGEQIEPGRRGVNNQVLSNVWSSRVDLKRRNDRCQELLEQRAEPLATWAALRGGDYPEDFLDLAWEHLLKNHPHDSICGCSVGQVHRDMHYRFDQCELMAEDVVDRALAELVEGMDTAALPGTRSVTLFNNSDCDDERVYVFDLAFEASEGFQNVALYDAGGSRVAYQRLSIGAEIRKVHRMRRLIRFVSLKHLRVAARIRVPARGYTTLSYENIYPEPLAHGQYTLNEWVTPIRYPGTMRKGVTLLDNGVLEVSVNAGGALSVLHKRTGKRYDGLLTTEDRGEVGDGWNYRRPLEDTIVTSAAASADVSVAFDGPFLSAFHVRQELMVPKAIEPGDTRRSAERVGLVVEHEVLLTLGSPRLEITTTIHNNARDHIVKLLFPSRLDTETFVTDTPFDLVERTFARPDRSDYVEPDTGVYPSQGFMAVHDASAGFAVFTRGLYEYEAYDTDEKTLALTLMRCFAKEVATHGGTDGQLLGDQRFEYAVRFFAPEEDGLYSEYREYKAGVAQYWSTPHPGDHPAEGQFLRHANRAVVISAYKGGSKGVIVRLVNTTAVEQVDELVFDRPIASAERVNLDEGARERVDHEDCRVRLALPPKKIVTLKLEL